MLNRFNIIIFAHQKNFAAAERAIGRAYFNLNIALELSSCPIGTHVHYVA